MQAFARLVPSRATLIIAPDSLVDHWQFQIDSHIATGAGCKVYIDSMSNQSSELPSIAHLTSMDIVVINQKYKLISLVNFVTIIIIFLDD